MIRLGQWLWALSRGLPDPELSLEVEGYAVACFVVGMWIAAHHH